MRKWGPTLIAAVAVLTEVGLGAIAAAQNAQLIGVVISSRYLRPDYLLGGFGVGLLLVYFAAKATHPAPAAIRLRFRLVQGFPLQVSNIGESEANEILVLPIAFDSHPWALRFEEIGSIAAGKGPELPKGTIEKRDLPNPCKWCENHGRPNTCDQFLASLGDHLKHQIEARGSNMNEAEMRYGVRSAAGLPLRFSVSLTARFYDGRGRDEAHHRLDVEYTAGQTWTVTNANCVFTREKNRGAVVMPLNVLS